MTKIVWMSKIYLDYYFLHYLLKLVSLICDSQTSSLKTEFLTPTARKIVNLIVTPRIYLGKITALLHISKLFLQQF